MSKIESAGEAFLALFSAEETAKRVERQVRRNRHHEEKEGRPLVSDAVSTGLRLATQMYRKCAESATSFSEVDAELDRELRKMMTAQQVSKVLEQSKTQVYAGEGEGGELLVEGEGEENKAEEEEWEKFPLLKHLAGQPDLKSVLDDLIIQLREPEVFAQYGVRIPNCILFHGPPGTGKTFSAKILANEAKAGFITKKASELMSKYVGEGSKNVGALFVEAEEEAKKHPSGKCILFIDEIDALVKERSGGGDAGSESGNQIVNEFLQNLDGFSEKEGVIVLGATNRRDILDEAFISRVKEEVYVGLPELDGIKAIFHVHRDLRESKTETEIFQDEPDFTLVSKLYEEGKRLSGRDVEAIIETVCRDKAVEKIRRGGEEGFVSKVGQAEIDRELTKRMKVPSKQEEESWLSYLDALGNSSLVEEAD